MLCCLSWLLQCASFPAPRSYSTYSFAHGQPRVLPMHTGQQHWGVAAFPVNLLESFIMEYPWQDTTDAWLSLSPVSCKVDLWQVPPVRQHSDFYSCYFPSNVWNSALGVGAGLVWGHFVSVFWCCPNKLPRTWCLKTKIYSFKVLSTEVQSQDIGMIGLFWRCRERNSIFLS